MTEDQKQRIDHYIQIYLNGIQSVSNDAGFANYGIIARLIDFKGYLPPPSGNDQSNLSNINAIRMLREEHAKFPVIKAVVLRLLETKRPQMEALLAKHYYVGQCDWTNKAYTDAQRAEEINQDLRVFQHNVKKAYLSMQLELEMLERYRHVLGSAC